MTAMDGKRPLADSTLDGEENVARDLFCIRCGTNLRGYNVRQPCPTCLHPISDSVWGDFLIYSQPQELKRVDDALSLTLYGAVLTAVVTGVAVLGMLVTATSVVDGVRRTFDTLFAGAIIASVVAVTGVVILTRRHSLAYYQARFGSPRIVLALGIAGVIVAGLLIWIAQLVPDYFGSCLLAAVVTVSAMTFFRGASRLMGLMPNRKLALHANVLSVVSVLLGGLVMVVLVMRHGVSDHPRWEGPLIAFTFLAAAGAITVAALGLRLLLSMRTALRAVR